MVREFQFYIVPTPIGNIKDITYRAIEVLQSVDIIACEDTRTTQKLLNHYNIKTKCISYHKYNEKERVNFLLEKLTEGNTIALVSDAGTPMICDPGSVLINSLITNDISFTALPGACAVTTFLSQIPRLNEEFTFIGFMSKNTKEIENIAEKYSFTNIVFYDSPERILNTLTTIKNVRNNAKIALGRELSKLFEEVKYGKIEEVIEYYKTGIKGEIVCMIFADDTKNDISVEIQIKTLMQKGFSVKEISVILSSLYDINKNDVYKKCLEIHT